MKFITKNINTRDGNSLKISELETPLPFTTSKVFLFGVNYSETYNTYSLPLVFDEDNEILKKIKDSINEIRKSFPNLKKVLYKRRQLSQNLRSLEYNIALLSLSS